jgi:hypothetical protein
MPVAEAIAGTVAELIEAAPIWTPPLVANGQSDDAQDAGQSNDNDQSESAEEQPEILIGVDERRVNDQAIAALRSEPDLFQRGNALVRVLRDEVKRHRIIR